MACKQKNLGIPRLRNLLTWYLVRTHIRIYRCYLLCPYKIQEAKQLSGASFGQNIILFLSEMSWHDSKVPSWAPNTITSVVQFPHLNLRRTQSIFRSQQRRTRDRDACVSKELHLRWLLKGGKIRSMVCVSVLESGGAGICRVFQKMLRIWGFSCYILEIIFLLQWDK